MKIFIPALAYCFVVIAASLILMMTSASSISAFSFGEAFFGNNNADLGSSASGSVNGPNTITVCQNGACPLTPGANTSSNCNSTQFVDGECLSFLDTEMSATCGAMGNCVYGMFYPTTNDCSGTASYNFSSVSAADSSQTNIDPACLTIDSASGEPTWTFFVPDALNNQYQAGLACGLQCSGCLALSPPQDFGTCFQLTEGSVRIDGVKQCRQSMVNVYQSSCQDFVPGAQIPVGSGDSSACRATNAITGSLTSISVVCNEPLPTTTLPPVPTTSGAPVPATTVAPRSVTRVVCSGSSDCKQDCRPMIYQSGQCVEGNPALGQTGSWFTVCTDTKVVTKVYNMSNCMASGETFYLTPNACYPDGQGGGWYTHCN